MIENLSCDRDRPFLALNSPNYQWVQLNVGLVRQAGDALSSARCLFAGITPLIEQWRETGCLQSCFFMRKPPDVRLRFWVSDAETVEITLTQQMQLLQSQGLIREFCFSEYQPEVDRFGGPAAMHCVHHYFDQDTSLWLTYDRLCQHRSIVPPETFLPIVFHDLFSRTLGDPQLVLQAWLTLGALTPVSPGAIIPQIQLLPLSALCGCSVVAPSNRLSIEEAHLFQRFALANQQFAELISLVDANQLTCDLCSILATIALFNFNRHGFGGERSGPLVAATIQAYHLSGLTLDNGLCHKTVG